MLFSLPDVSPRRPEITLFVFRPRSGETETSIFGCDVGLVTGPGSYYELKGGESLESKLPSLSLSLSPTSYSKEKFLRTVNNTVRTTKTTTTINLIKFSK